MILKHKKATQIYSNIQRSTAINYWDKRVARAEQRKQNCFHKPTEGVNLAFITKLGNGLTDAIFRVKNEANNKQTSSGKALQTYTACYKRLISYKLVYRKHNCKIGTLWPCIVLSNIWNLISDFPSWCFFDVLRSYLLCLGYEAFTLETRSHYILSIW